MVDNNEDDEEEAGGGFDAEVLKSYFTFIRRAIRERLLLAGAVFVLGMVVTVLAFKYLPRTYNSTTVLLVEANQVLEGNNRANTLAAAEDLIMRHENLEALVRQTGLVKKYYERRAPILKQKDRLMAAVFGDFSDEIKTEIVVYVLESRLTVEVKGSTLTIGVNWGDPITAAEMAMATRDGFVKSRHGSEMSAFQEKLAILDGHAVKLRDEIEGVAQQVRALREARAAEMVKSAAPAAGAAPSPRSTRSSARSGSGDRDLADLAGPELKEALEAKKRKLAELEGDRERRLREERAKLADLKLRLTPNHPEVLTAEQRLGVLSQEPSEIALLKSELSSLSADLKQRDLLSKRSTGQVARGGGSAGSATPTVEAIPTDIVGLLEDRELDPALTAQLYGAIAKYSTLRDEMRSGRIELDVAQAAFNHRYKIVVPAEPPDKPVKPKAAVILGAGFAVSLVLALLLPILGALRTGVMMARWQVSMLNLPVLGELRLPPFSAESGRGDNDARPS